MKAEAAEPAADGAQDFKHAERTRVLMETAALARAGDLLTLDGVVTIIPRMTPAKASQGAGSDGYHKPGRFRFFHDYNRNDHIPQSAPPAGKSLGVTPGATFITAAHGMSASDRNRAKRANDELVELVLGGDTPRPREVNTHELICHLSQI